MLDETLKLVPGQERLTPEQEAEARRFAQERIQEQLSTEPVDEQETGQLLQQAYLVAKLAAPGYTHWVYGREWCQQCAALLSAFSPPVQIHWVDGPLELLAMVRSRDSAENPGKPSIRESIMDIIDASVRASVSPNVTDSVSEHIVASVEDNVDSSVEQNVGERIRESIWESVKPDTDSLWDSARAYHEASWLTFWSFFDAYLAPNKVHALARFNERVSGYWLGAERAVLVRRPAVLSRDAAGRLHNATGRAIEYRDGWGFYAWHGVRVPEKVILDPDGLTREDFLKESNLEVRRVIQERMGQRFVLELGGVVLDEGPRGRLYEVALPDDPERVARYVQVQDASTSRAYFLRVPPTIQTAAEAVAWTFNLSVEEYQPVRET